MLVSFWLRFDLERCLGESLGAPWGTFKPRLLKNTKRSFLGDPFWSLDSMTFLVVSNVCFNASFKPVSCYLFRTKMTSRSPFQILLGTIWDTLQSKGAKVKIALPCRREHRNQALDMRFSHFLYYLCTVCLELPFS